MHSTKSAGIRWSVERIDCRAMRAILWTAPPTLVSASAKYKCLILTSSKCNEIFPNFIGDTPTVAAPSARAFHQSWVVPGKPVVVEGICDRCPARRWTHEALSSQYGDALVTVVHTHNGFVRGTPEAGLGMSTKRLRDVVASWVPGATHCDYIATAVQQLGPKVTRAFARPLATTKAVGRAGPHRLAASPGRQRKLACTNLWPQAHRPVPPGGAPAPTRVLPLADAELRPVQPHRTRLVTIGPGQALFIPRFWWHHVTALEPSINLNFWWSTGLRRVRSLPWDAWFVLRGRFARPARGTIR